MLTDFASLVMDDIENALSTRVDVMDFGRDVTGSILNPQAEYAWFITNDGQQFKIAVWHTEMVEG